MKSSAWLIAATLLTAAPVWAQSAQIETKSPLPGAEQQQTIEALGTLSVSEAPLRAVLEMLFKAYRKDYSIDNSISGYVTLQTRGVSFDETLSYILKASEIPAGYSYKEGVFIIKPDVIREGPEKPVLRSNYPRTTIHGRLFRVGAVRYEDAATLNGVELPARNFIAVALLSDEGNVDSEVHVVRVGDRISGGRRANGDLAPALTVYAIDPQGLLLRESDFKFYRVPLGARQTASQ